MKSKFLIILLSGIILLPSCHIINGGKGVTYTQLPAEGKTISIQPFTAIKANGVFNIILQQGTTESVIVKGDYPSDLNVTNDGNALIIIDTLSNHTNIVNIKTDIYVTCKQLSAIETESVGKINMVDTLKAGKFSFESNAVGESYLLLNSDSVTVSENGVGTLNIAGKAHYATIEDNGVGSLKAKDFKVADLHASVNGVGSAKVYADSVIYLDVNGIGEITYYGPAKVIEKNSSGIGKVEHGE